MRSNDEIMDILDRLKEEKGLGNNEIARRVGMAKSAISRYFNRTREFPLNKVEEFARVFGVSPKYLLGFNGDDTGISHIYTQLTPPRQDNVYRYAEHQLDQQRLEENTDLYVVGQTAAGEPITGQQAVPFIGAETLNLLVNGDSMEPQFYDGDIIKYHPQPQLENGEIGVFAVNGGITMKKFRTNGDIRLKSLNDKYEDIVITEEMDFSILGKVIMK